MIEKTHDKELDELRSEIANLRTDITKLFSGIKNYAGAKVSDEKDQVIEKSHQIWADLMDKFYASKARGKKVVREVTTQVEEHPFISIMIAFGVGYAIAKVCTRKAKNENTNDAD
ncbi:MAG: hypothetical protein PHX78_09095 [bacterium]|nr:hypothetical protein [bacterium]